MAEAQRVPTQQEQAKPQAKKVGPIQEPPEKIEEQRVPPLTTTEEEASPSTLKKVRTKINMVGTWRRRLKKNNTPSPLLELKIACSF